MRTYNEYVTLHAKKVREFIDLTPHVKAALQKSGFLDGIILVSSLHANAGILITANEPGFHQDLDEWLEKLAPFREDYKLGRAAESNASTYFRALLLNHQAIVPFAQGKLDVGPWQQVFYAEFDGQRPKRVLIKVLGE